MRTTKRLLFISFVAVVGLIISTQMASAYTVTTTGGYGPYQTGQGGEFSLTPDTALGNKVLGNYSALALTFNSTAFQSFCLEWDEHIAKDTTYNAAISNAAIKGGVGGAFGGKDPISIGTADLYYQFAKGTLAGYNYIGSIDNRKKSADELQRTIWWLEGEVKSDGAPAPAADNIFKKYIMDHYTTEGAAMVDNNGAFAVMALNLTKDGGLAQDQLVVVPVPAAVWLLGSGLLGLVGIRRRMSSRSDV
jgi:hypothetical protein